MIIFRYTTKQKVFETILPGVNAKCPDGFIEEYQGTPLNLNFDTFPSIDETEYDKLHPDRKLKFIARFLVEKYIKDNIKKLLHSEMFIPYHYNKELVESQEKENDLIFWCLQWLPKDHKIEHYDVLVYPSFMQEYTNNEIIEENNASYLLMKALLRA